MPVQTMEEIRDENRRLRIALADAIRRPPGAIPESAWEFCSFQAVEERQHLPPTLSEDLPLARS